MHLAFDEYTRGFAEHVDGPKAADGESDTAQMPGAPLYEDADASDDDYAV
jgi:hypothetical protein